MSGNVRIAELVGPGREAYLPYASDEELLLAAIAIAEPAGMTDSWQAASVLVDLYLVSGGTETRRAIAGRAVGVLFEEFLLALFGRAEPWMIGTPLDTVHVIQYLGEYEFARDALAAYANSRVLQLEGMPDYSYGHELLMYLLEHCDDEWILERLMSSGRHEAGRAAARQMLRMKSPESVLRSISQNDSCAVGIWKPVVEALTEEELEAVLQEIPDRYGTLHHDIRSYHLRAQFG
jgi:hypothetical protein